MSWFKRKPEKPLREQLVDARATLQREIEILAAGPIPGSYGSLAYDRQRADVLRGTLAEIEQQLADIEAGNA
jgi:hypothetical protein